VSDNAVAGATSVDHEDEVLAELTAPVPEVGDGGPEMIQLLTPEGQRVENTEYDEYVKDLTDEDLRGFYRDLVLIRRVDAEATALQRQGELGIWASLLGQEAAQIGSGRGNPAGSPLLDLRQAGGVVCGDAHMWALLRPKITGHREISESGLPRAHHQHVCLPDRNLSAPWAVQVDRVR
jgi:hypothetical protein